MLAISNHNNLMKMQIDNHREIPKMAFLLSDLIAKSFGITASISDGIQVDVTIELHERTTSVCLQWLLHEKEKKLVENINFSVFYSENFKLFLELYS